MSKPSRPPHGGPFILGLTGSIGMGKSTVAEMFRELGVPVFDADREVHRLEGPSGALVAAIEAAFPGTTGPGGVDRARLGALAFDDPEAMTRLERIVHPAVMAERQAFLIEHAGAKLVVFDIPLLFEKGGAEQVDAVLVVSAEPEIQRARVLSRPGMDTQRFTAILDRQMSDAEKRARADYVIETGGRLEATRQAVARLVANLTG
jgi:dephospho-CoA kinase